MSERRFAFDTNVIVSAAILPRSAPRLAVEKAIDLGKLLLPESILEELRAVFARARFDRYVSRVRRDQFLVTLIENAALTVVADSFQVCRDPKDDKFLELAVAAGAACVITGDEDLLALDPFQGIPIVTPRRFLDDFPFDEDPLKESNDEGAEG